MFIYICLQIVYYYTLLYIRPFSGSGRAVLHGSWGGVLPGSCHPGALPDGCHPGALPCGWCPRGVHVVPLVSSLMATILVPSLVAGCPRGVHPGVLVVSVVSSLMAAILVPSLVAGGPRGVHPGVLVVSVASSWCRWCPP